MKCLIYFTHAETLGETQRVLSIAKHISKENEVKIINSGPKFNLDLSEYNLINIPFPLHNKATLHDFLYKTVNTKVMKLRVLTLFKEVINFNPDIVIILSFPFQYVELKYELIPLLKKLKSNNTKIVCSLGYPLGFYGEDKNKIVDEFYDAILIHCPEDLDPKYIRQYFGKSATLDYLSNRKNVYFTNYILPIGSTLSNNVINQIMITRGSGIVGDEYIFKLIDGCLLTNLKIVLVLGISSEDELFNKINLKYLDQIKNGQLVLHTHLNQKEFTGTLSESEFSVSMCGYGTGVQLLYTNKTKSLLIPKPKNIDQEQYYRCNMLKDILGSRVIEFAEIEPEIIKAELDLLRNKETTINFEWFMGLEKTEELLNDFIHDRFKDK